MAAVSGVLLSCWSCWPCVLCGAVSSEDAERRCRAIVLPVRKEEKGTRMTPARKAEMRLFAVHEIMTPSEIRELFLAFEQSEAERETLQARAQELEERIRLDRVVSNARLMQWQAAETECERLLDRIEELATETARLTASLSQTDE